MRRPASASANAGFIGLFVSWVASISPARSPLGAPPNSDTGAGARFGPVVKEWDAEIRGLVPNRSVTWQSTSGADNAGAVTLSERGNITEMHVVIQYNPTWFEAITDTITSAVSHGVEQDLERFKRLAEGKDPEKAGTSSKPHMGEHGSQSKQAIYSRERE